MKKNTVYMQSVIIDNLLTHYSSSEISDEVLSCLNRGSDVQVYKTNLDEIIFRRKYECNVTTDEIANALKKAFDNLMQRNDKLSDLIYDEYGFEYTRKSLDLEYVQDVMRIKCDGRKIFVRFDI